MRRGIAIFLVALPVFAACGSGDPPETPAACLAPARAYLEALEQAPAKTRVQGTTTISDCLVEEQAPGALATVGGSMVEAATKLNARARQPGGEPATVRLGYLVGAAQEGASTTGGIHEDLVRRLDTAARYAPGGEPLGVEFERAFGRGYAAGQASG